MCVSRAPEAAAAFSSSKNAACDKSRLPRDRQLINNNKQHIRAGKKGCPGKNSHKTALSGFI